MKIKIKTIMEEQITRLNNMVDDLVKSQQIIQHVLKLLESELITLKSEVDNLKFKLYEIEEKVK